MSLARINLQLFAGEKTEPATPRRREEARRKGQVAKSAEVSTALIVLTAFLGLNILGPLSGRAAERNGALFLGKHGALAG